MLPIPSLLEGVIIAGISGTVQLLFTRRRVAAEAANESHGFSMTDEELADSSPDVTGAYLDVSFQAYSCLLPHGQSPCPVGA